MLYAGSPVSENWVGRKPARLRPCTTLVQDSAYSSRMWITLIKLLSAPLQYPKSNPDIHQVKSYAVGCYLRYGGFPRLTLLGFLVNRGLYLATMCKLLQQTLLGVIIGSVERMYTVRG